MFYFHNSHQLLARKAPLGQKWMAATMHAKIHRQICGQILNPYVPMVHRLSGILIACNDAADEVLEKQHQEQVRQQSAESKEASLEQKRHKIDRMRAMTPAALAMDYDQTIITGHVYQSWLKDPSDLVKEWKTKRHRDALSMMKISTMMELPSVVLMEQILNPSVPMALRLSGRLMGGVVISFERKVKLLYDDVTRLLVEINEAWKVKSAPSDPTRLPKGNSQAKYASVTLPPNRNEYLGEIEELLPNPNTASKMDFQQTTYFAMRLDSVDDPFMDHYIQGYQEENHHQAEAANITLSDTNDSYQADTTIFNHFERFDVEGDEATQFNSTQPEHTEIHSVIQSPPPQDELPKSGEILQQHHQEQVRQQSAESKEANLEIDRRRARRPVALAMDNDQTIITGHVHQSWLKDPSDLVRERKTKRPRDALSMMKISTMIELPSVELMEKLFTNGLGRVHYLVSLMEMWIRSIQPPHDAPSGEASRPQPPEPSSSSTSPLERMHFTEPAGDSFEGFHSGVGSPSSRISFEKQRGHAPNNKIPIEILIEKLRNNLKNKGFGFPEAYEPFASPTNSGYPYSSNARVRIILYTDATLLDVDGKKRGWYYGSGVFKEEGNFHAQCGFIKRLRGGHKNLGGESNFVTGIVQGEQFPMIEGISIFATLIYDPKLHYSLVVRGDNEVAVKKYALGLVAEKSHSIFKDQYVLQMRQLVDFWGLRVSFEFVGRLENYIANDMGKGATALNWGTSFENMYRNTILLSREEIDQLVDIKWQLANEDEERKERKRNTYAKVAFAGDKIPPFLWIPRAFPCMRDQWRSSLFGHDIKLGDEERYARMFLPSEYPRLVGWQLKMGYLIQATDEEIMHDVQSFEHAKWKWINSM